MLHVTRPGGSTPRGPVLLVHGAGVRAEIFRPPLERTLVDALLDDGFDVWMINWRASIDLRPVAWTLDEAAAYDYPAGVRLILQSHRSAESQGFRPLPGVDVVHDLGDLGARPRSDDRGHQRGVAAHDPAGVVGDEDRRSSHPWCAGIPRRSRPSGGTRPRAASRGCCAPWWSRPTRSATARSARWSASPTARAIPGCGPTATSTRRPTIGSPASSPALR